MKTAELRTTLLFSFALLASAAFANQAPLAKAGDDRSVAASAACTAIVILDGSASSDPDNNTPLTYSWTGPFGEDGALETVAGVKATATLGLGAHEFILTVTDSLGLAATDSVIITVADETPPTLVATASPSQLWPPNHKMVPVTLTVTATDNCGETLSQQPKIIKVESNESDNGQGDGNTSDDYQITGELTLNLRSERSGGGSGRIYTITLEAVDAEGNVGTSTVTVKVPHDMGGDDGEDDENEPEDGSFRTYTQDDWGGADEYAVDYLTENFAKAFPNGLKIGAGPSGISGNSALFTTPEAVIAFLPATGTAAPFSQEYIDPTETTGGELAGQAVALMLNLEFDARDKKFSSSKTLLKDLLIADEADPAYGKTVYEVLQMANAYLGGGTTLLDGTQLTASLKKINESYRGGENCDVYAKPSGCFLNDDDCENFKEALKEKLGPLYEKLKQLFDEDDDDEIGSDEKRKVCKSVREFKKMKKDRERNAKKANKGKGKGKKNDD